MALLDRNEYLSGESIDFFDDAAIQAENIVAFMPKAISELVNA
jgi:hypothetical protein